ncbi:MAG: hypothetical protein ACOX27_00550 [Caldicoprobacterales bacterium]|jgi:hypothetical protein
MKKKKRTIVILLLLLIILCPASGHAQVEYDHVIDSDQRVPVPLTYKPVKVINYLGEEWGYLKAAEDLFMDARGIIYIADTGNNRILKMTREGEIITSITGPEDKPLKDPRGVFVDKDGDLYIADTGNDRVVHLDPYGDFVEEFTRPDSELLPPNVSFDPNKVFVNSTGYIYIIKGRQFMMVDANNNFRGYVGAEHVGFRLNEFLTRIFASREQKKKIVKRQPPPYSNFVIHDDGMIYAVSNSPVNQLKKINSVGKNIYPEGSYGEPDTYRYTHPFIPYFTDIAVDKKGIISILEGNLGMVYQYDQEGNNLAAFGGIGNIQGKFELPSSLIVDDEGYIYVLDKGRNDIQVFEPTRFIRNVHEAVDLYSRGRYDEALEMWELVLQTDANYTLAHKGKGKALFKEGKYRESMAEYKLADDKAGYSEAFDEYRHERFRGNFAWITGVVLLAVYALYSLFIRLSKMAKEEQRKDTVWHGEV